MERGNAPAPGITAVTEAILFLHATCAPSFAMGMPLHAGA
jgi:hypothetical protein